MLTNGKSKSKFRVLKSYWFGLSLAFFALAEFFVVCFFPVSTEFTIPNQRIEVIASNFTVLKLSTIQKHSPSLRGFFNVSSGESISVLLLEEGAYSNWRSGRNATTLFSREQTDYERISLTLMDDGGYYLIFDNSFSNLSKIVNLDLRIAFIPTVFGFPVYLLYRFLPISFLFLLACPGIYFSEKRTFPVPKEILYLILFLACSLGLLTMLEPVQAFQFLSTLIGVLIGIPIAMWINSSTSSRYHRQNAIAVLSSLKEGIEHNLDLFKQIASELRPDSMILNNIDINAWTSTKLGDFEGLIDGMVMRGLYRIYYEYQVLARKIDAQLNMHYSILRVAPTKEYVQERGKIVDSILVQIEPLTDESTKLLEGIEREIARLKGTKI